MFLLLVGMVVGWGIWFLRMLRQWEKEEREYAEHRRRMIEIERSRLKALNIRPMSK